MSLRIPKITPLKTSEPPVNRVQPTVPKSDKLEKQDFSASTPSLKEECTEMAEEEDSTVSATSSTSLSSSLYSLYKIDENTDINTYKKILAEANASYNQLHLENKNLKSEIQDLRNEMDELHDQFRLDDADEFRQLQAELDIAAKNCRILQFKLRKLERRNEDLENEKIILQEKFEEYVTDIEKMHDLEEELLVAKEVSIRLHSELEQAEEWRVNAEKLNKDLKTKLDELKEFIDSDLKHITEHDSHSYLVVINKLYESMFREYVLQEQLSTMSKSHQNQNDTKQLREVTELLNSYQQKTSIYNEEITSLKQEIVNKDRQLEQLRLQLKNLKRSKSNESTPEQRVSRFAVNSTASKDEKDPHQSEKSNDDSQKEKQTRTRSHSADILSSELLNDEIKLLRNKISRLEDDLLFVTQERDCLASQLDKIEEKAMKTFTTVVENENEVDQVDLDSIVAKQIVELKSKIEFLNKDTKEKNSKNQSLMDEVKILRAQLEKQAAAVTFDDKEKKIPEPEKPSLLPMKKEIPIKHGLKKPNETNNLTDADKLLKEENTKLKAEIEDKIKVIKDLEKDLSEMKANTSELKVQIDLKEKKLNEILQKDDSFNAKMQELNTKNSLLIKKANEQEKLISELKKEIDIKGNIQKEFEFDREKLNSQIKELSVQMKDKLTEIEFLNRENNTLQERSKTDENLLRRTREEFEMNKKRMEQMKKDLEVKNAEIVRIENTLKQKENEVLDFNLRLTMKDMAVKEKLEECEKQRLHLITLQDKYTSLSADLDERVISLTKEIERLKKEKERLNFDLTELRIKYHRETSTSLSVLNADVEAAVSKGALSEEQLIDWRKIENEAIKSRYETKIHYLELEVNNLKTKMVKLLKDKEMQESALKESQQFSREISQKYHLESENWNKQRHSFIEKEKQFEESLAMRKELRSATDKLRQKLQTLEDQIVEQNNKHTIEQNNWDTQRLQLVSTINRLEEQLSKTRDGKKTKKEIESAWDKERKELHHSIQSMQIFMKDLQSQLMHKNIHSNAAIEDASLQESLQSSNAENDFLKNRIKELESMLDELEQVKRYMFDLREAYETDKNEWLCAREDYQSQLDLKDRLLENCEERLKQVLDEIESLISGKTKDVNELNLRELRPQDPNSLNSLCGGVSALTNFPLKPGANKNETISGIASKAGSAALPSVDKSRLGSHVLNDAVYKTSDKLKEFEQEFEPTCKKLDRVKDNLGTHRKFMDIVKSKSQKTFTLKPLNPAPMNEMFQVDVPGSKSTLRGSVPPDNRISAAVNVAPRAKSVCKDAGMNGATNKSSFFSPSKFFSLGRKINRFRFGSHTSETQEIEAKKFEEERKQQQKSETPQPAAQKVPSVEPAKKPLRERAMSPTKLFRTLRAKSPFARKPAHAKVNTASPNLNKSDSSSPQVAASNLMTMSCYPAVNAEPITMKTENDTENKTRSMSCEFIDESQLVPQQTTPVTIDISVCEDDKAMNLSTQRMRKMNLTSFNNEIMSSSMIESVTSTGTFSEPLLATPTSDTVKSVKFKDPPEMESPQLNASAERANIEEHLVSALDKAIATHTDEAKAFKEATKTSNIDRFNSVTRSFIEQSTEITGKLKSALSYTNVDRPPKPPSINDKPPPPISRSKFSTTRARTVDFPDLIQGTIDSSNQTTTLPNSKSTGTNKPIASILRRSETPPSTKNNMRQMSVESTESASVKDGRESSIEKRLRISSSTSRPLMFNN